MDNLIALEPKFVPENFDMARLIKVTIKFNKPRFSTDKKQTFLCRVTNVTETNLEMTTIPMGEHENTLAIKMSPKEFHDTVEEFTVIKNLII